MALREFECPQCGRKTAALAGSRAWCNNVVHHKRTKPVEMVALPLHGGG